VLVEVWHTAMKTKTSTGVQRRQRLLRDESDAASDHAAPLALRSSSDHQFARRRTAPPCGDFESPGVWPVDDCGRSCLAAPDSPTYPRTLRSASETDQVRKQIDPRSLDLAT